MPSAPLYTRDFPAHERRYTLEKTLPSSWYRGPEVFRAERDRIFFREWIAVCRSEELPNPGDFRVLDVLGESILIVRNKEGRVRAFYNVCRHRGSRLCRTPEEPAGAQGVAAGQASPRQRASCAPTISGPTI